MWASGFGGAPSVGAPAVWLVGFPELGTATTPSVPSLWLWDLSSLISLISWVGKFQTASALPGKRGPLCPRSISCWACTGGMLGCRGHEGHSLLSHGRLYACPWVCHAGLRQGCFRLSHCGSGEVSSDLLLKSRHWPNPSGRILTHKLILCWVLGSWGWWRDAQT